MATGQTLVIRGGAAVMPAGIIEESVIVVSDGRIEAVGPAAGAEIPPGAALLDAAGCSVLPGFIDTHVHGGHGDDVMSADPQAVLRMAKRFCRYGVTGFLPTTIAAGHEETLSMIRACVEAAQEQRADAARILGIHLEGPYINLAKKGAQPAEGIRNPDLAECREYLAAGRGRVRMMTLAPELPGAEDLIRLLVDHNVVVSMGHTAADYDTAERAIRLGASHATHLFNQMPPLHHRTPNLTAACLVNPSVIAELITDGVHLRPEIVQIAVRCKGREGVALITDAIKAQGMPDGEYSLGPYAVQVAGGRCTLANGTLAGSVHRMDRALTNTMLFSGLSLEDVSYMASGVPALTAGAIARTGSLVPGKDADLVAIRDGEVEWTMVGGEIVCDAE